MLTLYQEIALLLLTTAILGLLALRLRQPLIVGYLVIGIAVGPSLLNWTGAHEPLQLFAEIGVTVLLFAAETVRTPRAGLLAAGADDVLTPYADAVDHAARRIAAHLQPRSDSLTSPAEGRP